MSWITNQPLINRAGFELAGLRTEFPHLRSLVVKSDIHGRCMVLERYGHLEAQSLFPGGMLIWGRLRTNFGSIYEAALLVGPEWPQKAIIAVPLTNILRDSSPPHLHWETPYSSIRDLCIGGLLERRGGWDPRTTFKTSWLWTIEWFNAYNVWERRGNWPEKVT